MFRPSGIRSTCLRPTRHRSRRRRDARPRRPPLDRPAPPTSVRDKGLAVGAPVGSVGEFSGGGEGVRGAVGKAFGGSAVEETDGVGRDEGDERQDLA